MACVTHKLTKYTCIIIIFLFTTVKVEIILARNTAYHIIFSAQI